jgi:uncharacterized protein with HEPN domain
MPRREELYLADIADACRDVVQFLSGVTLDDWAGSRILQFAVLQRLTVIGEAARQIEIAVRERYPQVPWRDLGAFRNLAVHDYFAVEWPLVWAIATRDVPALGRQVRALLEADYPLVLASLDRD